MLYQFSYRPVEERGGFEPPGDGITTPTCFRNRRFQPLSHLSLVGVQGFEPRTSGSKGQRSTTELHPYFAEIILVGETGFEPVTPGIRNR